MLLDEYLTGNYSLNLSVSTDEGGEHDDEQGSLIAAAYPVRRTPSVDGVPGRHLGHAWEGAHRPFRRLDMAHAPLDEPAQDVEVDVGEATHVQAGLAGGVLPERSKEVVAADEARDQVNRESARGHSEPGRAGIALATGRVAVAVLPETEDLPEPQAGRRARRFAHQTDEGLRIGPLVGRQGRQEGLDVGRARVVGLGHAPPPRHSGWLSIWAR